MSINLHRYTNNVYNKKVLLLGIFPPPLGGISVHLRRVSAKLNRQGCQVWEWDVCRQQNGLGQLAYYWRLWRFGIKYKPDLVIYHTLQLRSTPIELCVLIIIAKIVKGQVWLVVHSGRFLASMGKLQAYLISQLLKMCKKTILVGAQLATEISLKIKLPAKFSCESPFLPPDLSQKDIILAGLPSDLKSFIKSKCPLVTICVTRNIAWQGQDLYGLDLALDALEFFKQDYPSSGLLVVIGCKDGYEEYFGLNMSKIGNIYFLGEWHQEMWPLIGKSQLFIRPTRSDSFGISICEALCQNVPVVASDVCPRPMGTVLFKSGDVQDLYLKMKQTWEKHIFLKS